MKEGLGHRLRRRAVWLATTWLGLDLSVSVGSLFWNFGWDSNYMPSIQVYEGFVAYYPGNSWWDQETRRLGRADDRPAAVFEPYAERRASAPRWDASAEPDPYIGPTSFRNARFFHFPQQLAWASGCAVAFWTVMWPRPARSGCPYCGYDVRGIAKYDERGTPCPECGALIHPRDMPVADVPTPKQPTS